MITIEKLYRQFLNSDGVTTDSRIPGQNKIFFALKGEKFNGNYFAEHAINNGCQLAIIDDPSYAKGDSFILVNNSLSYLQKLANYHRKQMKTPILAITGSNGKTTTKELISNILSREFKVLSTRGNLNNHIGVPLTLLNIKEHEIAIIEMGANHPGEIRELCEIAEPDYGLITNIGKAHLEGFGSFAAVKKAKQELFEYLLGKQSTIFVNYSDPTIKELALNLKIQKIIYGNDPNSICRAKILSDDLLLNPIITWNYRNMKGSASIQTNLSGNYNLENILAAFSTGLFFGVDPTQIISAIKDYGPVSNRSQIIKTELLNILILDAYNANPTSMQNAVFHFKAQKHENKLAIIGDMLELGKYSAMEHEKIINLLRGMAKNEVFLVGNEFKKADKGNMFLSFSNVQDLINYIKINPVKNHLVLLKGSRRIRLEQLLDVL